LKQLAEPKMLFLAGNLGYHVRYTLSPLHVYSIITHRQKIFPKFPYHTTRILVGVNLVIVEDKILHYPRGFPAQKPFFSMPPHSFYTALHSKYHLSAYKD
jgi:hypothetical protein